LCGTAAKHGESDCLRPVIQLPSRLSEMGIDAASWLQASGRWPPALPAAFFVFDNHAHIM
jgi:hypothetical protein